MIHIATVHWQTDKWIDIQLQYLRKYIKEDFQVYTFLNGIDLKYNKYFYYSCNEDIQSHHIKLNLLGEIIKLSSHDKVNDLILFLDGDAFPINDIITFIKDKISSHKLIAIQRIENDGDVQPHPAFCATTVGFWEEIGGTWENGYTWINNRGKPVRDVGGNLLKIMRDNDIDWFPLHRSIQLTNHPLLFGIYENLIYHHGAGFRPPVSRYDKYQSNFLLSIYYRVLDKLPHFIYKRLRFRNLFFRQNFKMSEIIYEKLLSSDFSFSQYFTVKKH